MFKSIFSSSNSSPPSSPTKAVPEQQRAPKSPAKSAPAYPNRATSMSTWAIPQFVHPSPERRIGILVTHEGLLVFPKSSSYLSGSSPSHTSVNRPLSPNSTLGSGAGFRVASLGTSSSSNASGSRVNGPANASASTDVAFLIRWSKEAEIVVLQPEAWCSMVNQAPEEEKLECFGIIGITKMFTNSYLFIITSSKAVGTYFHATRPIYCCTGVVAIPLLHSEASQAIQFLIAKKISVIHPGSASSSEISDDSDNEDDSDFDDVETPAAILKEPFFAEAVSDSHLNTARMPKSHPWLTRAAKAVPTERTSPSLGKQEESYALSDLAVGVVENPNTGNQVARSAEDQWHNAKQAELEEKVVRETAKHFARGEFWFTYDFDLTTPLQRKNDALSKTAKETSLPTSSTASTASSKSGSSSKEAEFLILQEPYANLPLWRRADRRFWHNEHMCKDLIQAGLHAYILPVMQGYIQSVALPITAKGSTTADDQFDEVRCQMMVISRRSKERAGLRYQRRGINDAGKVANYVETEQLVYALRKNTSLTGDVMSFVQFRGSIPLFWSQSPFTLKPPPVLERGPQENLAACTKHFAAQVERYGVVTCINLAEQGGKEGAISEAYRKAVHMLAEDATSDSAWKQKVKYVDFDFHKECSGMRFENVGRLIDQMQDTLAQMQFFHQRISCISSKPQTQVLLRQKGAFRVSCLDCLDRTNVVQSAFARQILAHQFSILGIQVGCPSIT